MGRVTDRASRYIAECLACKELFGTTRSDATTCSNRCRVWVHRHPELRDHLATICRRLEISMGSVQRVSAVTRLRPDLGERIDRGEIDLDQAQAILLDWLAVLAVGGDSSHDTSALRRVG